MSAALTRPPRPPAGSSPSAVPGAPIRRRGVRTGMAALAAVALIVVAALMLWSQQRVPSPRPAAAAPTTFSAQRAVAHLNAIARETRFLGSPNHVAARQYIVGELSGLGLRPELQRTAVVNTFTGSDEPEAGTVTNVIARLPGTASTGTVALNAHYDSGPGGPGASDCGSCVATLLETARALRAGPQLRNDIVFVFSDGEENGDLGAAAFAQQHPLMRDVDAVLNWETVGSHGPSVLMAANSSSLVQATLEAAPGARTYSFLPSLFRGAFAGQQLATDAQEYMDRGAAGVQFAYMRGTTDYHTRLDNVQRLGRGSLQMHGDYAVSVARSLGNKGLERDTGDRSTYFNVSGGIIVQYGPTVALALGLLASALFVACVVAGRRRGRLTGRGLVLGVVAFPLAVAVSTAASVFAWMAAKGQIPDLDVFAIGSDQNAFFVFGVVAFALAVFAALYRPLLRRARPDNLAIGALAWWLLLAVALTLAAPSAAYLFAWPALAVAAVTLWRLTRLGDDAWRTAAGVAVPGSVLLIVYAPVMLVLTLLALRLDGMGVPAVGVMGLFAALAAGLLIPYLAPSVTFGRGRRTTTWALPAMAALAAVVLVGIGAARLGYDATYPRPDFVSYTYNADTQQAVWQAGDRDSWTAPLLKGATKADIELSPFATFSGWQAPAAKVELRAPRITQIGPSSSSADTTLRLRVTSPRGADAISIDLRAPRAITAASIEGRRLPPTASLRRGELQLPYVGLPKNGIELVLTTRGHGVLRATLRDYTQGLPAQAGVPPRPADTMPAAISFRADPTIVTRSSRLAY